MAQGDEQMEDYVSLDVLNIEGALFGYLVALKHQTVVLGSYSRVLLHEQTGSKRRQKPAYEDSDDSGRRNA